MFKLNKRSRKTRTAILTHVPSIDGIYSSNPALQQELERSYKIRDAALRILNIAQNPVQRSEAAKTLHVSNMKLMSCLRQIQQEKVADACGQAAVDSNVETTAPIKQPHLRRLANPGVAKLCLFGIRIPLLWRDAVPFLGSNMQLIMNQLYPPSTPSSLLLHGAGDGEDLGDQSDTETSGSYSVFCVVRVGEKIQDTRLIFDVRPNTADVEFDDKLIFDGVGPDFRLIVEVYAYPPSTLRPNTLVSSWKRSLNIESIKRQSDLLDSSSNGGLIGSKYFELVGRCASTVIDIEQNVQTRSLDVGRGHESWSSINNNAGEECGESHYRSPGSPLSAGQGGHSIVGGLPVFGSICYQVVAQPESVLKPLCTGHLWIRKLTAAPVQEPARLYNCELRDRCIFAELDVYDTDTHNQSNEGSLQKSISMCTSHEELENTLNERLSVVKASTPSLQLAITPETLFLDDGPVLRSMDMSSNPPEFKAKIARVTQALVHHIAREPVDNGTAIYHKNQELSQPLSGKHLSGSPNEFTDIKMSQQTSTLPDKSSDQAYFRKCQFSRPYQVKYKYSKMHTSRSLHDLLDMKMPNRSNDFCVKSDEQLYRRIDVCTQSHLTGSMCSRVLASRSLHDLSYNIVPKPNYGFPAKSDEQLYYRKYKFSKSYQTRCTCNKRHACRSLCDLSALRTLERAAKQCKHCTPCYLHSRFYGHHLSRESLSRELQPGNTAAQLAWSADDFKSRYCRHATLKSNWMDSLLNTQVLRSLCLSIDPSRSGRLKIQTMTDVKFAAAYHKRRRCSSLGKANTTTSSSIDGFNVDDNGVSTFTGQPLIPTKNQENGLLTYFSEPSIYEFQKKTIHYTAHANKEESIPVTPVNLVNFRIATTVRAPDDYHSSSEMPVSEVYELAASTDRLHYYLKNRPLAAMADGDYHQEDFSDIGRTTFWFEALQSHIEEQKTWGAIAFTHKMIIPSTTPATLCDTSARRSVTFRVKNQLLTITDRHRTRSTALSTLSETQ